MSFQFNESFYLTNNTDVFVAVANGQMESGLAHYNQFGWGEGRDPNPHFDTSYYVSQNPDVADAVLAGDFASPLQHFLLYGAAEGRAPSESAAELLAYFDAEAYLAANPDVADAVADGGIANAEQHWLLYGQFENRPGGPVLPPVDGVFVLTPGVDAGPDFTGGDGDDVFKAELQQTGLLPIQTLNNSDDIDGGGGRNTLNAQLANIFTVPAGLNNIQVLNLEGNPGFLGILGVVLPSILDVINADSIDEINFRTPIANIGVNNLQTKLDTVGIYDDGLPIVGGNLFTINHIGDATDGDSDSLDINVRNASVGSGLLLTHAGGGADQGYEQININSTGPLPNALTVASTHGPSRLTIEGAADLTLVGAAIGGTDILNVGTLDEVDATAHTGRLTGTFTGTGDVVVNGSQGVNDLDFFTTGNVEVHGNAADDIFLFGPGTTVQAFGNDGDDTFEFHSTGFPGAWGHTSFTSADSVNGGDGDDTLILRAGTNAAGIVATQLLGNGVGAGIVDIETIQHTGLIQVGETLNVNWLESGSAQTLVLAGVPNSGTGYGGATVNVTGLENDDLVVAQKAIGTLNLNYNQPNALDIINLEMQGGITIGTLTTLPLTEVLTIDSTGTGLNQVNNASGVNGNIIVTGTANLLVGNAVANAFAQDEAVIDAADFGANLRLWVNAGNQTINDGAGDDFYTLSNTGIANTDVVNLSGGSDTVWIQNASNIFNGPGVGEGLINGDLHHINGFDVSGDGADLLAVWTTGAGFGTLVNASNTTVTGGAINANWDVTGASALVIRDIEVGESAGLGGTGVNFLKFTTAVNGAANAQILFNQAIGGGTITTGIAGNNNILGSAYDATNEQAVFFVIDGNAGSLAAITTGDDVDGFATVSMSYEDYLAFDAANLTFIA